MMLLVTACAVSPEFTSAETSELTFIHMNDTYRVGDVEEGQRGGFGRVATVIRDLQQQGKVVRVLHGGDFLYPSLESQLWNGLQMVDALNFLDALAPLHVIIGNHELDRRTPEHLINAVRESNFDWLGDNYRFETGAADVDDALQRTFTFTHADKTIGVFAVTAHVDDGGNDRDYAPIDKDYVGLADAAIRHLEDADVDVIIGITHLYMHDDEEVAKLRKGHPKFAFVVGGHDHEATFKPQSDESAAIMKGASNARSVWQIDLRFDVAGAAHIETRLLQMDQDVAIDADYALLQNKWRDRLLEIFPFLKAKIGVAAFPLDAAEEVVRSEEAAWGNFVADQMLTAFGDPPAELAFIHGGSLRIDDFIADDILFEDVARTFGFSTFLRYITMSGAEFREVLEAGYRGGRNKGYFPQIAGFRVCVNHDRPSGSRIASLQLPSGDDWKEIDAAALYTVVVPDFLYLGGDGYQFPKDRPASRPGSELKFLVLDAILRAQSEGREIGVAVDPSNPRYVELRPGREGCWSGL